MMTVLMLTAGAATRKRLAALLGERSDPCYLLE